MLSHFTRPRELGLGRLRKNRGDTVFMPARWFALPSESLGRLQPSSRTLFFLKPSVVLQYSAGTGRELGSPSLHKLWRHLARTNSFSS